MGILKESIGNITALSLKIKSDIAQQIVNLPDNPNIKRIERKPNCFILNSSQLSINKGILSPEYYDWKYQYNKIIQKVEKTDILILEKIMNDMILNGWFKVDQEIVKLHPDVIEKLKSIIH